MIEIIKYNGYTLHINPITDNPNGRKTQTVLIYKEGEFVAATYADIELENAIEKAKAKVDKRIIGL